jgi:uncharacterized DUF497 family protein
MKFEFDSSKSISNKIKHGLDFVSAQSIWDDPARLEMEAESLDEPRFQIPGIIGGKVWSAFITYRSESVRIISVRRARENEEQQYYDR